MAEIFDKTSRGDLKFKIDETQFVTFLRNDADQATRKKIGEELARKVYDVSNHPVADVKSRVIECRKWILSLVNEHGRIKTALVTDRDWLAIPDHPRHECVRGLGDYLEQLLAIEFTEFCDSETSTDAAVVLLKARNLRLHFDLSVANTGRAFLGDINSDSDWLRPLMNSVMAVHESRMRDKLNLPPACEKSDGDLLREYETFERALLAGEPTPIIGIHPSEA